MSLKDKARQAAGAFAAAAFEEAGADDASNAARAQGASGLMADNRAQNGASSAVNLVVALVVGGLMAAFLLPIAIDEIAAVDTTSWSSGAGALWDILPVMVVLAIFLFFVGMALKRSNM